MTADKNTRAPRRLKTAAAQYHTMTSPPAERVHIAAALKGGHPVRLPDDPKAELRVRLDGHNGWATLVAWVDHGRWVAACPSCLNAQMVDPDDPRFFCYECGNADLGGVWARVHFPKPNTRKLIEEILAERPEDNAHWMPHETVGDLADENEAHGLAIPKLTAALRALDAGLPPQDLDRVTRARLKNPRERIVAV